MARVLAQDEAYAEALAALDVAPGSFAARYNEVRGDIHAALGDAENARAAYNAALNIQEAGLVDRNLVQMKLDDLPPPSDPLAPVASAVAEGATADGEAVP